MNIQLFTPYKKQKEFIDRYIDSEEMFGVVVAPRGSGKTLLGMNILLYWMLSFKNQKGGWISPVYAQAKSVYDQIVIAAKDVIIQQNRQDMIITFVNNSTIKFLSTDNVDSVRGFRFNYVVVDEMAFQKDLSITQVVLPTLNPNGKKCLMISTPRGKNHFYDWYLKGGQDGSVVSHKIPLTECPYVQPELIEEARKSLPPELFKQEFLAEFSDVANDVFVGVDNVSIVGAFDRTRKVAAFVGVDTGLTTDKSVITIMSETGRVLWMEGVTGENITAIANRFTNVMADFNIVGGNIESNGIGKALCDLIIPKYPRVKEFVTTQNSKTEMVRKLIRDIEALAVELPVQELCPELHQELSDYTYKISPSGGVSFGHPNGKHDDFVMALLLANYSRVAHFERGTLSVRTNKVVKPVFGLPR